MWSRAVQTVCSQTCSSLSPLPKSLPPCSGDDTTSWGDGLCLQVWRRSTSSTCLSTLAQTVYYSCRRRRLVFKGTIQHFAIIWFSWKLEKKIDATVRSLKILKQSAWLNRMTVGRYEQRTKPCLIKKTTMNRPCALLQFGKLHYSSYFCPVTLLAVCPRLLSCLW